MNKEIVLTKIANEEELFIVYALLSKKVVSVLLKR